MSNESQAGAESNPTASPAIATGTRLGRLLKSAAKLLMAVLLPLALLTTVGRPWLEKHAWGRVLVNQTAGKLGFGSDPDFVLVAVSIDESLFSKTWKLVRWWPGRRSAKLHEDSIRLVQMQIDDHQKRADDPAIPDLIRDIHRSNARSFQDGKQRLLDRGPSTVCRIQYQVVGDADEAAVRDQIFVINDGAAWALSPEHTESALEDFRD